MTMIRKELIREKCRKYLLCRAGSGKAQLQDFRKGGGEVAKFLGTRMFSEKEQEYWRASLAGW